MDKPNNDINQYLQKRAQELGLERGRALKDAQAVLDDFCSGQARAKSLNNGTLQVTTSSSVVASELRLNQIAILNQLDDTSIKKLHIKITG